MNTYNLDKMYESYSSEVERMQKCIDELQQENKQLKDNWNKLKEYMIKEQTRIVIENTDEDEFIYADLLNKMQELLKDF